MDNFVIISCIFGKRFKYIHPSPDNKNSFFFTNNINLKNEILNKGWNYIYVNKPLSDDFIISSLQSKYIKFLQFLEDFPEFKNIKTIIYFDHKEYVSPLALSEIKLLINNNIDKSLIIRHDLLTGSIKNNIYDEVNAAQHHERYAKNMNKTIEFIKSLILSHEISEKVTICNTGLLIYINKEKIKELLNSVYDKCNEHQQPECQIYWNIFSQKYKNEIKEINWNDIKNIRRTEEIFIS